MTEFLWVLKYRMMKKCNKCFKDIPLEGFYKRPKGKFGVSAVCKTCLRLDGKSYYQSNRAKVDAKNKKNKIINRERYRKTYKKWAKKNKEKRNKQARERHLLNREKEVARVRKYNENNRDIRLAYYRNNKEKVKQSQLNWKIKNRDKYRQYYNKRRLAVINSKFVTPDSDKVLIEKIYKEAVRLTVETGIKHEVDHIIPLQGKNVCGLHVSWNLQVLPFNENRSKGNKICF